MWRALKKPNGRGFIPAATPLILGIGSYHAAPRGRSIFSGGRPVRLSGVRGKMHDRLPCDEKKPKEALRCSPGLRLHFDGWSSCLELNHSKN